MKKRINTIDGKILVQGGTDNELKSNEIRVNADKTLTERVDGKIVSVGGSGATDNPDDYEKRYTLIATDASGAVKQHTAEELHWDLDLPSPFLGFDPVKLEIVCEYIKDGVPYRFIPETYRVTLKFGDVTRYPYFDYELVDNVITINVQDIDWYVTDHQFTFDVNGETIIQTYIKDT